MSMHKCDEVSHLSAITVALKFIISNIHVEFNLCIHVVLPQFYHFVTILRQLKVLITL